MDLELEMHAWVKKFCWIASARTRLASRSMRTFPRAHSKAANPSSHMVMESSLLSSSLSQARSYPYSSMAITFEGDGALQQSMRIYQCHDKEANRGRRWHRAKTHLIEVIPDWSRHPSLLDGIATSDNHGGGSRRKDVCHDLPH
jgi:hypothetical protein